MNALDVHHLTVKLGGRTIVEDVSLSVEEGETVALIGPNGAGKSVLVKTILRLLPKASGEVRIFGKPHEEYRKVAPLVSYVPQFISIERTFPLTVEELFALKRGSDPARQMHCLKTVGAQGLGRQRLGTLSGGQLQRIFLAFALVDRPRILFLDEPSSGIDIGGEETIYNLIRRVSAEEKMTVVLISHDIDIVAGFAQHVFCINRQLICSGPPAAVLTEETLRRAYGPHVGVYPHHPGPHPPTHSHV
ncbi:MAG: metal ABC transporter ATP-binding protein [bacterium]|nr:metal ABC transporter ATP-binding protein [bacterium]